MGKIKARLVSEKQIRTGHTAGPQYLTGLDIFGGMVTVPLFYVYPQGLNTEAMARSLAVTLRKYPLVARRMKKDRKGYPYIDADDAGVPFSVYDVDGPMPDYGPDYPTQKYVEQYYKRVYPWTIYKPDTALFSVKVFRFEDGGAIASLAPVHTLIDGSSIWMFMQDWSKVAQGLGEPDDIVERDYLLNLSKQLVGRSHPRNDVQVFGLGARLWLYARLLLQAARNKLAIHRIPPGYLAGLRDQFLKEYPDGPKVSEVDLITAQCLKVIAGLQDYRNDLCLGVVVDFRSSALWKFPGGCLGSRSGRSSVSFRRRN